MATWDASRPDVTVAVLLYNGVRYLPEAIASVQLQDVPSLEILVIDDGSTDGGGEMADRMAVEDPRIRVIHKPNAGLVDSRNVALREARAPLIAYLDHDDVFLPGKLAAQLAFLHAHPDVAVLGTYGWRIGERGRVLSAFDAGHTTHAAFERACDACEVMYLLASSVVARREVLLALGGFRTMPTTTDVDMWTRVSDRRPVLALPERLTHYRVHDSSVSGRKLFDQLDRLELMPSNTWRRRGGERETSLEEFRRRLAERPWPERARRWAWLRSRYAYRRAGGSLADRNPVGALWLALSFALYPAVPFRRLRQQLVIGPRGR